MIGFELERFFERIGHEKAESIGGIIERFDLHRRIGELLSEDVVALARQLIDAFHNRAIARASAEVAGHLLDELPRLFHIVAIRRLEQAHGDAWRTIAALRCIIAQNRILNRMPFAIVRYAFDRIDLFAVEHGQIDEASVDRAIAGRIARIVAENDCTRAAVALIASFFRSR